MTDPTRVYKSTLHASQITNIAADRASLAKLRSNVAEIDTLIVNNAFNLPDGSLSILSSGTGEHLTTDPDGGTLTNDAFSLKTLTSSDASILITASATEVDLVAVGGGGGGVNSVTPVVPPGAGEETLIVSQTGAVTLKNLASGSASISITSDPNNVVVTGPALSNAGVSDAALVVNGAGPTFTVRGIDAVTGIQVTATASSVEIGTNLVAGTGITLTPAVLPATDITVINAGVTSIDHTVAPIAGEGDIVTSPPATGAVTLKVLQPGPGITLDSSNANYIKINNVGAGTTPTFTAGTGDEPLFDGSPLSTFTPTFKSLTAGTGVTLSSDANAITINSTGGAGVTSLDQAAAPGVNEATLIVGPPATGAVLLKNILGGTGVTVTTNANDITLSAGAGGATLSEDATATGTGNLVAAPSPGATDFRIRAILAGSGMAVSTVGGDVQIDNIAAGQVYTLADDAAGTVGANTASVVSAPSPTANDFRVRRIVGSSTATVTQVGGDVTLSVPASGMAALAQDSLLLDNTSDAGGLRFDNILIRVSDSGNNKPPSLNAATNTAASCVAIGNAASTTVGTGSVAVGSSANTAGFSSVAVGLSATTGGATGAVAVGRNSNASGGICVAVGDGATASGANCIAVGRTASSSGGSSVAVGQSADASGANTTAVGAVTSATMQYATAVGNNTDSTATAAVTLGNNATTSGTRSITLAATTSGTITNTETGACYVASSAGTVEGLACFNDSFSLLGGGLLSNTNVIINTGSASTTLATRALMNGYILFTNAGMPSPPTVAINLPAPESSIFTNAAMNLWNAGDTSLNPGTGGFFCIDNRTGHNLVLDGTGWVFHNHSSGTVGSVSLPANSHIFFWQYIGGTSYDCFHLGRIDNTPL